MPVAQQKTYYYYYYLGCTGSSLLCKLVSTCGYQGVLFSLMYGFPTPVFLPGESQGWWSLVGYRLWGQDMTEVTQQQQQHGFLFAVASLVAEQRLQTTGSRVVAHGLSYSVTCGILMDHVISSSWVDPLIIMQCPSLSLFTAFVLKSILSDMSIAILLSFGLCCYCC